MVKHIVLAFLCLCLGTSTTFAQKSRSKKIFHFEAKSVRFSGDGVAGETYYFKPAFEAGFGIQYPITSRVSFTQS